MILMEPACWFGSSTLSTLGSSTLGSSTLSILKAAPKILETLDALDTRTLDTLETLDNVSATRSLLNCETSLVSVGSG